MRVSIVFTKITARLRQLLLKSSLAFNWLRYDRLSEQRRKAANKQDAIASRIDRAEGALFHLYAKNAWLSPKEK